MNMEQPVSLQITDGIAIVTICNPPVNALSHAVRSGLSSAVKSVEANAEIQGAVLICDGRTFMAGADVKEFGKPPLEPILPEIVSQIELSTKPWVAAIHGSALGGGLEVALGCHYRIALSNSKFGMPEVNLGLIPGAGGTVRLPRCISMQDAIRLITLGKVILAKEAHSLGLVDKIFDDDLPSKAVHYAVSIVNSKLPSPLTSRAVVEPLSDDEIDVQREVIKRKARGQISSIVAFDTIVGGVSRPFEEALEIERHNFATLKENDQSKALRHIFFAERSVLKLPELKGISPRPCSKIGVIGGGTMGAGIAAAVLLSGLTVIMIERDAASVEKGQVNVRNILDASLKRHVIDKDGYTKLLSQITYETDYKKLNNTDFVIEAVFEDMDIKQQVFKALDEVVRSDTILASNTSYLDVNALASVIRDPSRVVGLHFFSPAHIMKLVEVIRTDSVSLEVLATGLVLAKKMKKLPVVAGVCDGFIGNRMMSAYRRVAEYMLLDGVLPYKVDAAMKTFGFPMGIFEMQDLAGLDIGYAMRKRRADTRSPDERYVQVPDLIVEMDRLGRKNGMGYYSYTDGKTPVRDPKIEELIISESSRLGIFRRNYSSEEIIDNLLQAMKNEGEKIVTEKIAMSPDAIDVVMVNGYGFPRWRGGPMFCTKV